MAVGAAVCARCGRFIDPRESSDSITTTSIGLGSPDRSIDGATARRLVVRGGESRGGRGDEREHQGGRHGRPEHQRRNRTSRRLLRDTRTGRQSRSIIRASRAAWGGEPRALTSVLLASLGVKLAVAARALQIVAHHTVLSVPVTYCAWGGVENTSGHLHGIAGRIVLSRSATRASRASVSA